MSKLKVEEVKSSGTLPTKQQDRVAAHSHITGLGLDPETGMVIKDSSSSSSGGMVGQIEAREACGLVVDLVKSSKLAGRAILLAGAPGTGKTALALALSQELGTKVPFVPLVGSQVVSTEVKQTEIIMQHIRRSIGLRIRETKEVYEGEVIQLEVNETEDPLGGYGRTISHIILGLKTTKGTKTLRLDPTIYESLTKEKVTVGDVIYIESNSGSVKRLGRSDVYATEYDLETEEYVPIPKGDVHKRRQVVQDVTLHDLDVANAQPSSSSSKDVLSLIQQINKPKKTEITDKLRDEINRVVNRYISEGIAELIPGVLFIDEVHMLDMECFTYLNKSLESTLSPILVMATNRGLTHIRTSSGSEDDDSLLSPHGIPMDVLDRMLIIRTRGYNENERYQILKLRANVEGITDIDDDAIRLLASIGNATTSSLRFAIQLLTPARIVAESMYGRTNITVDDIKQVQTLFLHAKTSSQQLSENGDGYLNY